MILTLPFPPSVNMMYRNLAGRGRVKTSEYRAWERVAALSLWAQLLADKTIKPFEERCQIEIQLDQTRQGDCSNRIKAVEDFLVSQKIIKGDQKKYVKKVSAEWADVKECVVRITPL